MSESAESLDHLTDLMRAAWQGDVGKVRSLLRKGEPVEIAESHQGLTALMFAAKEHHAAVCRALLEQGADPHRVVTDGDSCFSGYTPLLLAAMFPPTDRLLDTVTVLLDAGGDPDSRHPEGDTALHCGAAHLEVAVVRLLLARGADVEGVSDHGDTPLIVAVRRVPFPREVGRRLETVRLLLDAGADPRRVGDFDDSAFSLAESRDDQAVMAELLRQR